MKIKLLLLLTTFTIFTKAQTRKIPTDTSVITNHTATINRIKIPYSATTGTQAVYSGEKAIATLYYTYYKRTDISDMAKRPLVISFNGGPGSASVWM
ncbi:MAG: carboxypeptidase, partial [Chitinophagales bacterium]